ncbi:MAG: hypothetical protein HRU49_03025 [Winogradskyella sp.]|uniref:hypothetical protein n=1 Tax=Winogradskyella sp. TaxID=1883156 RepID=UPI0025DBB82E|nr:hypothetical protein [Winogradskyella sp.]NRB82735.1 hypothetical protein [Winogradskyella sp.]
MLSKHKDKTITLTTDYEGHFKLTITDRKGMLLCSEYICSKNQCIVLKGFSLNEHSVTIAPIG